MSNTRVLGLESGTFRAIASSARQAGPSLGLAFIGPRAKTRKTVFTSSSKRTPSVMGWGSPTILPSTVTGLAFNFSWKGMGQDQTGPKQGPQKPYYEANRDAQHWPIPQSNSQGRDKACKPALGSFLKSCNVNIPNRNAIVPKRKQVSFNYCALLTPEAERLPSFTSKNNLGIWHWTGWRW